MKIFRILYARPALFFRLSGLRMEDYDKLLNDTDRSPIKKGYGDWLGAKRVSS